VEKKGRYVANATKESVHASEKTWKKHIGDQDRSAGTGAGGLKAAAGPVRCGRAVKNRGKTADTLTRVCKTLKAHWGNH